MMHNRQCPTSNLPVGTELDVGTLPLVDGAKRRKKISIYITAYSNCD